MKQLAVYFLLAYLLSWMIWLPLYAPGLSLPVLPLHHAWGGLGPLIAAFVCTRIFEEPASVRQLAKKCVKATPFGWLLLALLGPFVLAMMAAMLQLLADGQGTSLSGLLHSREFPQWPFATWLGYNLLFFGFGEEAGWRGFALPRLQTRMSALWASILLTLFWAIWHWPLFLYRPGYTSMDLAGTLGWLFSLLTGSVLLTLLFNSSRGSVLICAVFHATIDIAFTADISETKMVTYMGMLITFWGIAVILVYKPRSLTSLPKIVHLDATHPSSELDGNKQTHPHRPFADR